MTAMDNQHVRGFHEALETWTDQRFVTRDELEALAMFGLYLVNLIEEQGFDYFGHTYKEGTRMGCLVVKATREGTPLVAFTNARDYAACVRVFLRRLQEDRLGWRNDRYRS